ncbi:MAG: glycosyltransferase family 2 protein [Pontiella sp.]
MKISIITATYNSEASIVDTVRSLQMQDFPRDDIEWILVDGASTDNTLKKIQAEEFHPDLWVSEPDQGIYDALNKGVKMATGDFVGFLHADDVLASRSVLYQIGCALNNSDADAVYGDLQYVRPLDDGEFNVVRHWTSGIYYGWKLRWGWMPPHPTLYVKREIFEQTKLGNGDYFDTTYTCAADYDFMLRIFSTYNIEPAYLRMVLVKMRVGGVSNRSLKHIITKSAEDWRAIRSNKVGHLQTLVWKNVSKLGQFLKRTS